MKLTFKIALFMLVGVSALLLGRAYLRVDDELANVEARWRADEQVVARALAPAVERTWRIEGEEAARYSGSYLEQFQSGRTVRLVRLDEGAAPDERPAAGADQVRFDERGAVASAQRTGSQGRRFLHTYVPLATGIDDGSKAALELTTELPRRDELFDRILGRELRFVGLLVALTVASVLVVGGWLVGRPVSRLASHAEAVGGGDLEARVRVRQRDELGLLARTMNRMAERLASAREQVTAGERARLQALEQLRHAERLATTGELAAGIAHELGTPLNVIRGRAALIVDSEEVADEDRRQARVIIEQADRITRIVRGLLDFARQRKGKREPFDLRELAAEVVDLLRLPAEERSLQLRAQTGDGPVEVFADREQMQQVLTNLVMNALDATTCGEVVVACEARGPQPAARLCVTDEGPGIEPDALERLFDPFFTTKELGVGTGLGLSIAYGIVEEHGGHIEVESSAGRGSRFTVRLPEHRRDDRPAPQRPAL